MAEMAKTPLVYMF